MRATTAPAASPSTRPDRIPTALSEADVQAFRDEGVLVARGLLAESDLEPVRLELSAQIDARARELHAAGKLPELHQDAPFTQRIGLLMAQCPSIHDGFDIVPLFGREMHRFFRTPRLLDALERLIGPELSHNPIHHVRAKPPIDQTAQGQKGYFSVPWHQDSGVTVAEADASEIVTVWLPLGNATEEMGCLQVLPGAAKLGHLPHVAVPDYGTSVDPAAMPRITPRKLPVVSGDVIFMHRHCPHHSTPNRSDECRWSLDLRFHRTGDHSGRPWQPESVVRSRANPASVENDYDRWVASWKEALAKPGGHRVAHRVVAK